VRDQAGARVQPELAGRSRKRSASSVTKHGSSIAGDIQHIVVVHTNSGDASNPGHAGTGTEVAVFC
jgi:adenine specific DNA methylase Mod